MSTGTAVSVPAGAVRIEADLAIPTNAQAVVIFAHGSGSSRHSPRNRYVAAQLRKQRYGTVLADLLTPEEERDDLRFDIDLLAARVTALTGWAANAEATRNQPIGLFGASTGAAAALVAASQQPTLVRAVVSRGGRPDLAGPALPEVRTPTLLIVGDRDPQVLLLNQESARRLAGPAEIQLVRGASHLFEEPGTLAEVAERAARWFAKHLLGASFSVFGGVRVSRRTRSSRYAGQLPDRAGGAAAALIPG